MAPGGGCIGWPPLLPGPNLGMGLPPRGGAPDGSIFLRSSLKGSSFFDGLSVMRTGTQLISKKYFKILLRSLNKYVEG